MDKLPSMLSNSVDHLFAEGYTALSGSYAALPFLKCDEAHRVESFWSEPFEPEPQEMEDDDIVARQEWGYRAAAAFFIHNQRDIGDEADPSLMQILGDMPAPLTVAAKGFLMYLGILMKRCGMLVSSREVADDVEARLALYRRLDDADATLSRRTISLGQ